ncbi:MAG: LysR family transcriptional regulator [Candidatus Micrarchaeaceae archaeon]
MIAKMQRSMPTAQAPIDWNDISILLALARAGAMRKASLRLGVNTSTISRRVAAAEARLQTRLFIRGPAGYKPTDAGRIFLDQAERIERSMYSTQ